MARDYICACQNSIPVVGGYALRGPVYNPPIPPWTIRVRMATPGDVPVPHPIYDGREVIVSRPFDDEDIYDITYEFLDWTGLLRYRSDWGQTTGKISEIIGSNTPDVWNMTTMVSNQDMLTTVTALDTSGVHTMVETFWLCTALTSLPAFNASSMTNAAELFRECTSLVVAPLFNTGNLTNMNGMFYRCTSLASVPAYNTASMVYASSMFCGCTALETAPALMTALCATMDHMFDGCTALKAVPLYDTSSCNDMNHMFAGCVNVESGALALYTQASSQVSPPSYHYMAFNNCGLNTTTGAAELAQIPADWK